MQAEAVPPASATHTTEVHQPKLALLVFRKRVPKHCCPASAKVQSLCRMRASKRWSALLTQEKLRIGYRCGMRKRLGKAHWAAFVKYAEAEHKAQVFRALTPATDALCCAGKIDGTPYPKQVSIDMCSISSTECETALEGLHMDHPHDVQHVCKIWSCALPEEPQSWDDGVCGPLLGQLLFGTDDHIL